MVSIRRCSCSPPACCMIPDRKFSAHTSGALGAFACERPNATDRVGCASRNMRLRLRTYAGSCSLVPAVAPARASGRGTGCEPAAALSYACTEGVSRTWRHAAQTCVRFLLLEQISRQNQLGLQHLPQERLSSLAMRYAHAKLRRPSNVDTLADTMTLLAAPPPWEP